MASAVSAIFILDLKGKVLISRNYRGDIPMSAVEKFLPLVLEAEEDGQTPAPCFTDDGINYMYIRHNNLFCKSSSHYFLSSSSKIKPGDRQDVAFGLDSSCSVRVLHFTLIMRINSSLF